jgi:hypothetical protein
MSWIELHEEVRAHPKIRRLAKDMGVSNAEARGWIIGLWLWAATYAEDGELTDCTNQEIADACDYEGRSPGKLVQALIARNLIDVEKDRRYIHDWSKHGLRLLESNRERQRKFRERVDTDAKRSNVTLPNVNVTPTLPNHTIPNQTKETATAEAPKAENITAAAVKIPETQVPKQKHPENKVIGELAAVKPQIDFGWLPGLLLEEWGRDGRVGYSVQEKLVDLGKLYTVERLKYAIREAAAHNARNLAYVKAILEPKQEKQETESEKKARLEKEYGLAKV